MTRQSGFKYDWKLGLTTDKLGNWRTAAYMSALDAVLFLCQVWARSSRSVHTEQSYLAKRGRLSLRNASSRRAAARQHRRPAAATEHYALHCHVLWPQRTTVIYQTAPISRHLWPKLDCDLRRFAGELWFPLDRVLDARRASCRQKDR